MSNTATSEDDLSIVEKPAKLRTLIDLETDSPEKTEPIRLRVEESAAPSSKLLIELTREEPIDLTTQSRYKSRPYAKKTNTKKHKTSSAEEIVTVCEENLPLFSLIDSSEDKAKGRDPLRTVTPYRPRGALTSPISVSPGARTWTPLSATHTLTPDLAATPHVATEVNEDEVVEISGSPSGGRLHDKGSARKHRQDLDDSFEVKRRHLKARDTLKRRDVLRVSEDGSPLQITVRRTPRPASPLLEPETNLAADKQLERIQKTASGQSRQTTFSQVSKDEVSLQEPPSVLRHKSPQTLRHTSSLTSRSYPSHSHPRPSHLHSHSSPSPSSHSHSSPSPSSHSHSSHFDSHASKSSRSHPARSSHSHSSRAHSSRTSSQPRPSLGREERKSPEREVSRQEEEDRKLAQSLQNQFEREELSSLALSDFASLGTGFRSGHPLLSSHALSSHSLAPYALGGSFGLAAFLQNSGMLAGMRRASRVQHPLSDLMHRDLDDRDYELLLQLDESCKKNNGASPSQIKNLSTCKLEVADTCSICLEEMQVGLRVRKLPCSHVFHQACIDKWLSINKQCPIDKKPII